ncbi:MAG: sigma-54-dependent Fis family transcriptional regulator [bacterium]|nr:sigma-54-dependent Fis family transcriptional regulator [bacterium]
MKTKLLIVEDDRFLRNSVKNLLPADAFTITEAESITLGREALSNETFDLVLLDLSLPDGNGLELVKQFSGEYKNRMIILTGTASIQIAVTAMKSGVFDFLEKPVNPDRLITTLQKAAELTREFKEYRVLRKELNPNPTFENLIYKSKVMEELIRKAKKLALSESTVLIHGETGTGKELQAHSIHNFSRRKGKPFISVNCASIPENLAESELFGYEKGAFTGAGTNYPGKFRLGHTGTVFLDEVAELPMAVQGKLLRTLDSGEVSPLKSTKPVTVDVRVIAATNKNLEEQVQLKNFREDLFYRIAELKIYIPPLRDREEDILSLAEHFLKITNITNSKNITGLLPEAAELLLNYTWPGNIRELKNTINEISALMSGTEIKPEHLPSKIVNQRMIKYKNRPDLNLKEMEKKHILKVLKMTNHDYHETYKLLGISRATLYRKFQEYKIEKR